MTGSSRDHDQSTTAGQGNPALAASDAEWTEGQFEALVCLHMLQPGQVLTEDDCWAIEYTRRQADEVENNAVDAFDDGRKFGIVSVAGKTDAAMFEEIEKLRSRLAVEKALKRHYYRMARDAGAFPRGSEATVTGDNAGPGMPKTQHQEPEHG